MNTTTSFFLTSLSMNCSMPMDCDPLCAGPSSADPAVSRPLCSARSPLRPGAATSPLRHPRLQRERVERPAHLAPQRLVDELMLLDARFAPEGFGDDGRGIMVAVAREVADRDLGVRDAALDQPLDLARMHRHCGARSLCAPEQPANLPPSAGGRMGCPRGRVNAMLH